MKGISQARGGFVTMPVTTRQRGWWQPSLNVLLLLTIAFAATLVTPTAHAQTYGTYDCSPAGSSTGSKCQPDHENPFVYTVISPNLGSFLTKSEAETAAASAGVAGGLCTVTNPVDGPPSGQGYNGSSLTYYNFNVTFSATGTINTNQPCQYNTSYYAQILVQRNYSCPSGYTFIATGGPYCACPWGSLNCVIKPCYKGAVSKADPCNVLAGVMTETQTDYDAPGSPLKVERHYNSAFANAHYKGREIPLFGRPWVLDGPLSIFRK